MHVITFKCNECQIEFAGQPGQKPNVVWTMAQLNGWRQREYNSMNGRAFHRTCKDCTPAGLARRRPMPLAPEHNSPPLAPETPHPAVVGNCLMSETEDAG